MTTPTDAALSLALEVYLDAIRADYSDWNRHGDLDEIQRATRDRMIEEFHKSLEVSAGKSYLKIITHSGSSRSVHSFIVLQDSPRFKRGDILKAAGWAQPAKNHSRGNIFGTYRTRWTGAEYLR